MKLPESNENRPMGCLQKWGHFKPGTMKLPESNENRPMGCLQKWGHFKQEDRILNHHYWENHPFINLDYNCVRTRAYFHWLNRDHEHWMDDRENWCLALQEEIQEKLKRLRPVCIPGHEGEQYFREKYTPILNLSMDPSSGKRFIGTRNPRVCTICGKGEGEVTFRSDAHLIPELLNNNVLFTFDECDTCNIEISSSYESHLGNMLMLIRAASGFRRKGTRAVKLKPQGGISYIGGQARKSGLEIGLRDDDETISIHSEKPFEFTVKARVPGYTPQLAMKALARVLLQALPRDLRSQHQELQQFVLQPEITRKCILYLILMPFPFRNIGISLWKRREEHSHGPEIVMLLYTSIIVMLFPLPSSSEYPELHKLPELPYVGDELKCTKYRIGDSSRVSERMDSITFGYERMLPSLGMSESVHVEVELEGVDCVQISTNLSCRGDGDVLEYSLHGEDLHGICLIELNRNNGEVRVSFTSKIEVGTSVDDMLRALVFIRTLLSGSQVTIASSDETMPVRVIDAFRLPEIEHDDLPMQLQHMLWLSAVEKNFGFTFDLMEEIPEPETRILQLLGILISGDIAKVHETYTQKIILNSLNDLEMLDRVMVGKKEVLTSMPCSVRCEVQGNALEYHCVRDIYDPVLLNESMENLRIKLVQGEGPIEVTLQSTESVYYNSDSE